MDCVTHSTLDRRLLTAGLAVGLLLFAVAVPPVSAAVLAGWNFTGLPSTPVPTEVVAQEVASFLDSGALLNRITRSADLTGEGASNYFQTRGFPELPTSSWDADAFYLTFTLAPKEDHTMSLNTLYWNHLVRGGTGDEGPRQIRAGYRVAGESDWTVSPWYSVTGSTSQPTWNFTPVTTSDSVEFRIWGMDAVNSDNAYRLRDNTPLEGYNFVVLGTENVVPEPGALGLMTIGFFTLYWLRTKQVS